MQILLHYLVLAAEWMGGLLIGVWLGVCGMRSQWRKRAKGGGGGFSAGLLAGLGAGFNSTYIQHQNASKDAMLRRKDMHSGDHKEEEKA